MNKTDILVKIKETEKKVEQSKKKALEEKEKAIKDSKIVTMKVLDEAKAEAQRSHDAKISQTESEIENIRKRLLSEGEKKAKEFKAKANLNSGLAVDLLIKRFEEEVS